MTPTAQAAAKDTEVAAALMTAKVSSVSMRSDVRNITAIDEATIAADETATDTPMRASMNDAGNVTAAAAAAVTTDRVIVVPACRTFYAQCYLFTYCTVYNSHVKRSEESQVFSPAKQEPQLSLGWADRTAYIRRPAFHLRSRQESDFPE